MNNNKLLATGGHAATTAYAVFQEFKRRGGWELFWIGAKSAREDEKIPVIESEIFFSLGVKVFNITMGRLQRKFTKFTIPSLFKIPSGFFESFVIMRKVKPSLVLSFGGFVSIPVVFWAWIFGIPVVVHEQVATSGLSNRITSKFAQVVAVAFEENKKEFSGKHVVVVGNPISDEIRKMRNNVSDSLHKTPRILVTGGSRGSRIINETLKKTYTVLLRKYEIVHLVGRGNLRDFEKHKNKMNIKILESVSREEMANLFSWCDIVVSRAGANTIWELGFLGKISLFIPIPWVERNEQYKNAQVLVKLGISKILPQDKLSPSNLVREIEDLTINWEEYAKNREMARRFFNRNAQEKIFDIIVNLTKK